MFYRTKIKLKKLENNDEKIQIQCLKSKEMKTHRLVAHNF